MTGLSQIDPDRLQEPVLRRATPTDAAALAAIGRATFTETFGHLYTPEDLAAFLDAAHSPDSAAAALADPATAVWLAEAGGQVVGYAVAGPCSLPHPHVRPGDGELKRLYLSKAVQAAGLGGRLFDAAAAWLEREGPRTLWIDVWSENHAARRFYRRRGFEEVGEFNFAIGRTIDRELILRRAPEIFSGNRS